MIIIEPPSYRIATVAHPRRETLTELNRRLLREGFRVDMRGVRLVAVRVH